MEENYHLLNVSLYELAVVLVHKIHHLTIYSSFCKIGIIPIFFNEKGKVQRN